MVLHNADNGSDMRKTGAYDKLLAKNIKPGIR